MSTGRRRGSESSCYFVEGAESHNSGSNGEIMLRLP